MSLKNRNIISKIRRSKVTDYAALRPYLSIFERPLRVICISSGELNNKSSSHE